MARPDPARRGAAPPARSRRISADPGPAEPAAAGAGALGVVDTARTLLEVDSLRSGYGSLPVLHGISFGIHQGETVVLLGLNGAGKSTTLASIAGLLRPWSGGIHFDGHVVTGHGTHDLVARGIVLVPEGRRIFPALSVANNLRVGSWTRRKDRAGVAQNLDRVLEYFPVLADRQNQLGGTLSGGEQQMLAIARGMMSSPRLLLVDEASLGLAPKTAMALFHTMARINADGVTVVLVEQNVGALRFAHRALVMQKGVIVYEGSGRELLSSGELRQAYLGAPA